MTQTRIIGRALRHNGPLRQLATKEVLAAAVATYVPEGEARAALLAQLAALSDSPAPEPSAAPAAASVAAPAAVDNLAMEVEAVSLEEAAGVAAPRTSVLPEVEVYLALLVLTTLLRTPAVPAAACVAAAEALASRASAHNRRSLDGLRAKAFHFLSLAHERNGSMAALRPRLLAAHRTACLQVTTPASSSHGQKRTRADTSYFLLRCQPLSTFAPFILPVRVRRTVPPEAAG